MLHKSCVTQGSGKLCQYFSWDFETIEAIKEAISHFKCICSDYLKSSEHETHFVWFLKIQADTTVDCFSRKEKSRVERETEVYIN